MKTLIRSAILVALFALASISSNAQSWYCYYGYGYIYGGYPYCDYVEQGQQLYTEWWVDYPYQPSTLSIDISTNGGKTWNEVVTGLSLEENCGGCWYGYTYVTIPWTLTPSTNCHMRYREVPDDPGDCAYLYDGYSYSYDYGCPFTIAPGCYQPAITSQPADAVGCVGFPLNVPVGVDIGPGTPNMQYQWYKGTASYSISTSTPNLIIGNVQTSDAGSYYCIVRNLCGKQVTTRTLTLTVQSPAAFTQQPVGGTVCPGTNYTLTCTATGTNVRYQWTKDSVNIPGATQSSYSINGATVAHTGRYRVNITASCGNTVISNAADIVVPSPPVIVTQPQGGGFCPGSPVSITPNISGSGLSYQWYKGDNIVPGQSALSLSFSAISPADAGYYWLKVTGGSGACISSTSTQTINVYTYGQPQILKQPSATDICVNGAGELVVEADGTDLTYQWYRNGSPIPNSNNYALVLNPATPGMTGDYTVTVRSVCNGMIASSTAHVDVVSIPVISSHPMSQDLQVGQTLTLSVAASDAKEVTWYHNEVEIATGTATTFTKNNVKVSDGGYYRAVVKNVCGPTTSRSAKVVVTDPSSLIPVVALTAEEINLGDVPLGYEKERTFDNLIMNVGSSELMVSDITFGGTGAGDFALVNSPGSFVLQPGESQSVTVRFHPNRLGTSNSQMVITSNANPPNNSLSAHGNGVVLYSIQGLSFGDVELGKDKNLCLDITNTSSSPIAIDQVSTNSGEFSVTSTLPLAIAGGATEQLCVTFAPSGLGLRSTTLAYTSSTGGNSSSTIDGTGIEATSVAEDAVAAGMTVYPNPSSGFVSINTGNDVATTIKLIDINGRAVASITPKTSLVNWDLSVSSGATVPSGTYTVMIETAKGRFRTQLVINR